MWKNKPSVKARLQDQAFFSHLKEAIIVAERALLYMLGFEFTMVNPQRVAIIMVGISDIIPQHALPFKFKSSQQECTFTAELYQWTLRVMLRR